MNYKPGSINGHLEYLTVNYLRHPKKNYQGYIREFGFALAYQRFWWKGIYTGVYVMPAWQTFVNDNGNKIDNGFQIFNTYRARYHFKLFNNRFFIQPAIAVTHRPYHTKMPESFKQIDDKWNKVSIGEVRSAFWV